ncbi:MAG: major capsid protein [Alphaproteobacteria bacterium]
MASMDIFRSDAFSLVALTLALEATPYVPQRLGQLNLFTPKPVTTTSIQIEDRAGKLSLIQTSIRGQPLEQMAETKRKIRNFSTVRLAKGDKLTADQIQNLRAFGTESELASVQAEVARKMVGPGGLREQVDLTHENMRLGAVQGILKDADGSTITNFFTEFGVVQPDEVDFDLSAASPASGVVREKCNGIVRAMMKAAAGAWTPSTMVHALCGDAFWDRLTAHKEVRETYLNTQQAADLREGNAYETFRYGGIVWENYRGTDDGTTMGVHTDKAVFFPVGAPGVFEVAFAPGETFDTVNTPGKPFYAMTLPDLKRNAYVDLEIYSYPLFYCTRPLMLQRAKRAA